MAGRRRADAERRLLHIGDIIHRLAQPLAAAFAVRSGQQSTPAGRDAADTSIG